jgi:hypothetical protein
MEVLFQLETIRFPLVGLGIGLEDRRMSGENEVLPENFKVHIWSRDRTYGPKYHSRRTALSSDIRSKV